MTTVTIAINERGNRVGDSHHNAKLTNHEIDLLLSMHESGDFGYRKLAKMFELNKSTVRYYVKGRYRSQTPAKYKLVRVIDQF